MSIQRSSPNGQLLCCLTIDVEDWFHILNSRHVPDVTRWSSLESRLERNLDVLLAVLDTYSVKVTFFWLGWLAERHKALVHRCRDAGHEIASHGYAHVLAYQIGPKAFRQDIARTKAILENTIGEQIRGFRAPGFGVTGQTPWAFDVIKEVGYQYDSSVFPGACGHGGMSNSLLGPHFIETSSGHLLEIPMSVVDIFGHRTTLFGGGYLRLAHRRMIQWGIEKLKTTGQPLIVYVHPREIDPDHPRLPLSLIRRFKCYVNVHTTLPKLKWLCRTYSFGTMLEMVEHYVRSFYHQSRTIPVMRLPRPQAAGTLTPDATDLGKGEAVRAKVLGVERAMADLLGAGDSGSLKVSRSEAAV